MDTVRSMVATTSDSTFFDGEFLLHSTLLQNTMKCFRMKAAMKASLKFNAKPKADNADDEQAHEFASPASHEEGDESEGCQDDDEVPDVY